jgi:hypothetical protein
MKKNAKDSISNQFSPSALFTNRKGMVEIIRLTSGNVPANKRKISGKAEGERLFQGMMKLLLDNFPATEIENESQYRRYFRDKHADDWFVEVAVEKGQGKVVGASLYSYCAAVDAIMYNIIATDEGSRRMGVGCALINNMIENGNKISQSYHGRGLSYVLVEIEQPDFGMQGSAEELKMKNEIRPAFHDNVSCARAIRLADGNPLVYLLPIMATEKERAKAKLAGDPFEPEPLMLCARPISAKEENGISAKEAARLLIWFYKDYLEVECSDVRGDEVNNLLAIALASLAPGKEAAWMEQLLNGGKKMRSKIMEAIPEVRLSFMKISETGINKP